MTTTNQILEGPRMDVGMNIKMDTSLEQALKYAHEHSSLSPSSTSSDTAMSDRGGCHHSKLVSHDNYDTCFQCGAYVSKNGTRTFKSKRMNYSVFFSAKSIYETMIRRSFKFSPAMNPEYSQIRQNYVEWVLEIAEKLKISPNSAHLGVLLLDTVMYRDTSLTPRLQLYAPICLLIASKTMELDERIPFIPRLRRYANPTFSIEDYRKAELHVLDMVDWNAQFSSALEISEFLMSQGVLFSSDEIEDHVNVYELAKWSPEALRENTQHENINHLEVKTDDKKETGKDAEKTLSPSSKENQENSLSDVSTTAENVGLVQQQEEGSPTKHVAPLLLKQHSTPAYIETGPSTHRAGIPIEKKVNEIITHFETSYAKLATLLIRDVDFIEWEPKVVSASMMAFFRCVNKITPIWNGELETITQLKFHQISACFDLIYKKYTNAFSLHTNKLLTIVPISENQKDMGSDLRLNKAMSSVSEKSAFVPKLELATRTSSTSNTSKPSTNNGNLSNYIKSLLDNPFLVESDSNVIDPKVLERKSIFSYQPKNNIPAANPSTASTYNYLRDDLRFRTKFPNGTINTEMPQRHPVKNPIFPANMPRFNVGLEHSGSHHNNVSGTATYSTSGTSDGHGVVESYSSRNSSGSILNHCNPSHENSLPHQGKGMVKK